MPYWQDRKHLCQKIVGDLPKSPSNGEAKPKMGLSKVFYLLIKIVSFD